MNFLTRVSYSTESMESEYNVKIAVFADNIQLFFTYRVCESPTKPKPVISLCWLLISQELSSANLDEVVALAMELNGHVNNGNVNHSIYKQNIYIYIYIYSLYLYLYF